MLKALQILREKHCSPAVIAALEGLKGRHAAVQRNIKDALFTNLFSGPEYLLQLYQSLHPEDETVAESDIRM